MKENIFLEASSNSLDFFPWDNFLIIFSSLSLQENKEKENLPTTQSVPTSNTDIE